MASIGCSLAQWLEFERGHGWELCIYAKQWTRQQLYDVRDLLIGKYRRNLTIIDHNITRGATVYRRLYEARHPGQVLYFENVLTLPVARCINIVADEPPRRRLQYLDFAGSTIRYDQPQEFVHRGIVLATTTDQRLNVISKEYLSFPSRVSCLEFERLTGIS